MPHVFDEIKAICVRLQCCRSRFTFKYYRRSSKAATAVNVSDGFRLLNTIGLFQRTACGSWSCAMTGDAKFLLMSARVFVVARVLSQRF